MAALNAPSAPGRPPGGGSGGGWRAFAALSVPAFAWEFLRRNPVYQADYRRWMRMRTRDAGAIDTRWGLRFVADPALPSDQAEVYWRPEVAPGIVVPMERAAAVEQGERGVALPVGARRLIGDELHVRSASGLQLLLRGGAKADEPLIVVLAYDPDFGLRVRAVEALERLSEGRVAPRSRLTAAQRTRLARCLVALDGALRHDSYRSIAENLFGPEAIEAEAWRTASVRGVTIRLVRAGRALMEGGYLSLLRGGL